MADKKTEPKSARRKLGEAFTKAVADSLMNGGVSEAVQRAKAAKSGKAAKGSKERGEGATGARKASGPQKASVPAAYVPGRPEDYRPEYVATARAMCRLGATDFDLATEFGVTTDTIWRWRCKYSEFSDATLEGKEAFDNRAERSLAMRAVGYSYHSEKVFNYEGQIIRAPIVEHVPPDVNACRLWLMNRRPDKWRDRQEVKIDGSDAFLKMWAAISDGTINTLQSSSAGEGRCG